MADIWKHIPDTNDKYDISNTGNVRNNKTGQILKPRKSQTGYLRVHIKKGDKRTDWYIHRLVADAFCFHPYGCDVVNHIDNNPMNNNANNLEWTTQRKNVAHAMSQGRVKNFPNAKQIIGIKDGIKHVFFSSHEAAQFAGCDHKTVLYGCKTGRESATGFTWKRVSVWT